MQDETWRETTPAGASLGDVRTWRATIEGERYRIEKGGQRPYVLRRYTDGVAALIGTRRTLDAAKALAHDDARQAGAA